VWLLIPDDGPSPGNDTPSDVTDVEMLVWGEDPEAAVSAEVQVTVHNVNPGFYNEYGQFLIDIYDYPPGGPDFVVSGPFYDPGSPDDHEVTIDWGDGSAPTVFVPINDTVAATHHYAPDGLDHTITVTVEDDDTGSGTYSEEISMYLLDLDNDADNNGAINEADDPIEHVPPGAFVGVNADDDNENEIPDLLENGPVSGENDLEEIELAWEPTFRPYPVLDYTDWHVVLTLDPPPVWDDYEQEFESAALFYTSPDKSGLLPFENTPAGWALEWTVGSEEVPGTLYIEALAAGQFTFQLELREPGWTLLDEDPVVFTAVEPPSIDLDVDSDNTGAIDGTPYEESEEMFAPGKMMRPNTDDDNGNGTPDKDDPAPFRDSQGNLVDDDDLRQAKLHLDTNGVILTNWTISFSFSFQDDFKLWETTAKQGPVTSYTIGADDVPETVFIEGLKHTQAPITVTLKNPAGVTVSLDEVVVTVVQPDAIAYRPQTTPFAPFQIPPTQEDSGVGIRRNGDDDDGNSVRDFSEASVGGENDLIQVLLLGGPFPGVGRTVARSDTQIQVWKDREKNDSILAGGLLEGDVPASSGGAWVEWAVDGGSSSTFEFALWDSRHDRKVFLDEIPFQPFTSVTAIIGGNLQTPGDPNPDGATQGLFNLAIDIYQNSGRDVHMYGHWATDDNGDGTVYDEFVSAINDRGVTDVAIMGYSWGGGDTYNLAWRLQQNTIGGSGISDITKPFTVAFTGYVDAVATAAVWLGAPESRKPPLSTFHCNQYETNTEEAHGAASGGIIDLDWTSAGLDHYNIDDDHTVVFVNLKFYYLTNVSP
jgi:hypothetical protein